MKKKLGRLSLESFDNAPTGNVQPKAQPETPPQPLVPTAGYSETPFSGEENYAAESNQEQHDVGALWKALLAYYRSHHDDDLVETLSGGASLTEINKLETTFHIKLPSGYSALLELADGQDLDQEHDASHQIFGHRIFNSIERVIAQSEEFQGWDRRAWDMYHDRDTGTGVRDVDFSPKWLVFGGSQDDDHRPSILVLDFDPAPEGTMGQVVSIDFRGNRRVVVGPDFLTWFKRFVAHLTSSGHSSTSMESFTKAPYPLRKAMEADAMVVDVDDLDQLAVGANSLSSYLTESGVGVALESEKNPSDIAKSKMHLRFKKLKDGFVDTFRSAAGMASKYEKQLDELEAELLKGHTHGQIKVNMSSLWQHFSDEKGPITHNLVGKVREDVAFSTYILTVFSEEAYQQLEHLQRALHTGQGTDDEQAKRTAMDVEKLKGPAEYIDQKWICAAGEQPYLSVTGLSAVQGRHPRPVAIEGVSLDRLALLSTPYHLREYGSFLHGLKKMFVNDSKKETHLAAEDLGKLIVIGREYIASAKLYLAIYNKVWPIFRRLDDSLDMIWDDFGLTDYEVNIEGEAEDGSDDVNIQWQTSDTGNVKRRLVIFDQLMQIVSNFADAVLQPGVNELARALRAAKFHGYLVAAGIKAAEGQNQHAGNVAHEASFIDIFGDLFAGLGNGAERKPAIAQELFGFGGKKEEEPAAPPVQLPDVNPEQPPAIAQSIKVLNLLYQKIGEPVLNHPDPKAVNTLKVACQRMKIQLHGSVVQLYSAANGQDQNATEMPFSTGPGDSFFEPISKRYFDRWISDRQNAKEQGKQLDFVPISHFGESAYVGVNGRGEVVASNDDYDITVLDKSLQHYLAECVHISSVTFAKRMAKKK